MVNEEAMAHCGCCEENNHNFNYLFSLLQLNIKQYKQSNATKWTGSGVQKFCFEQISTNIVQRDTSVVHIYRYRLTSCV